MVVESFLYIYKLLFDTTEKQNIHSWCKQHSFHGESMLPCKAFTWPEHRTNFKLGLTFYCKTTVVKIHLQTNQVMCDLEFRTVECQLRYFANTTLTSPIFNSLYQKLGQFLDNPSIYIDVKTEICIRPTSSAHVTTALCW